MPSVEAGALVEDIQPLADHLSEALGVPVEGYVSSDYEDVFAFIFLVCILIFRPAGILGRSETEKV